MQVKIKQTHFLKKFIECPVIDWGALVELETYPILLCFKFYFLVRAVVMKFSCWQLLNLPFYLDVSTN